MRARYLALSFALAASQPALAGALAPVGQAGTLRVEIDVSGRMDGRPVHRAETFVVRMQAGEPANHNGLAATAETDSPAAVQARQQRDARLEQRMATARASQQALDMDAIAIARACDRDQDSAECKAGQRAFAASMGQVDQAMRASYSEATAGFEANANRFQPWQALQGPGGGCGTVEAKVLDPGKPQQVARLPASAASAQLDTCFHSMVVDTQTGELFFRLASIEVLRPGGQRGDFVIEGADFGEGGEFDNSQGSLTVRAAKPSGSASYRSFRGTTVVRWSFQRG